MTQNIKDNQGLFASTSSSFMLSQSLLLLLWGWLYWFCVCIMQHPGSFKTMGSTAVVCEENVIRKTEKKERKKREIL